MAEDGSEFARFVVYAAAVTGGPFPVFRGWCCGAAGVPVG